MRNNTRQCTSHLGIRKIKAFNGYITGIGRHFTENRSGNPPTGTFVERARKSYHAYKSADAPSPSYYGRRNDIGSPGFFESMPAAPSTKRTLITKWAELRQK